MASDIRYLRQLKSGHIYVYTEALAKRPDMVPYDPEVAKARIAQMKQDTEARRAAKKGPKVAPSEGPSLKEMRENRAIASELTDLENQAGAEREADLKAIEDEGKSEKEKARDKVTFDGKTAEEVKELTEEKVVNNDPKIQKIGNYKQKKQLKQFVLIEFGIELDDTKPLKVLKDEAVAMQKARIFETPVGE